MFPIQKSQVQKKEKKITICNMTIKQIILHTLRDGKPMSKYDLRKAVRSWKPCDEQTVDRQLQRMVKGQEIKQKSFPVGIYYKKV